MKIIEKIVDISNNTEEIIERDATPQEIEEATRVQKEYAARMAEQAEKAELKKALLAKLGITENEAKLLLS